MKVITTTFAHNPLKAFSLVSCLPSSSLVPRNLWFHSPTIVSSAMRTTPPCFQTSRGGGEEGRREEGRGEGRREEERGEEGRRGGRGGEVEGEGKLNLQIRCRARQTGG